LLYFLFENADEQWIQLYMYYNLYYKYIRSYYNIKSIIVKDDFVMQSLDVSYYNDLICIWTNYNKYLLPFKSFNSFLYQMFVQTELLGNEIIH